MRFLRTLLIFLLILVVLSPNLGKPGSYNAYSGLAYCTSEITCYHEIGHAIDTGMNWVSQSNEFVVAISWYLINSPAHDPLKLQILYTTETTKQNLLKEIYAWTFAYFKGDVESMPDYLQPFFDTTLSSKYMLQKDNKYMWLW